MTRTPQKLYREFALVLKAINNCRERGNNEWLTRHEETLAELVAFMPSGSGIDCGTTLNRYESTPERLVFDFSYHHTNDGGMYIQWTDHQLIVTASLAFGIDLEFTGMNEEIEDKYPSEDEDAGTYSVTVDEDMGEYFADVFGYALEQLVWQDADCNWYSDAYAESIPSLAR